MLIVVWIVALLAIPLTAIKIVQLWVLVRTGRFKHNGVDTTRAGRPGWYSYLIVDLVASIALYLFLVGLGIWTLLPHG